jgi:hypothetical protein
MFERTYDRHALDTSVRRGVASYQQMVGSPASPEAPPHHADAAPPPPALPLFRLPAPPRGPGGAPSRSPGAGAHAGAGAELALALGGGGARAPSPSSDGGGAGDDADALETRDDGDLLVARLQAAYGKRPRASLLAAGTQPLRTQPRRISPQRATAAPARRRRARRAVLALLTQESRPAAAAASPSKRRPRAFPLLPHPPLSAAQVARLDTGAAVRAAVAHYWDRAPEGGNLAYWRRRLSTG